VRVDVRSDGKARALHLIALRRVGWFLPSLGGRRIFMAPASLALAKAIFNIHGPAHFMSNPSRDFAFKIRTWQFNYCSLSSFSLLV